MSKRKTIADSGGFDPIHKGHVRMILDASKYGDVIVGLLSDKAVTSYKKLPQINYKQREIVLKNIKYVKSIIPQYEIDYTRNLNKIKPDYVVHGDDWKKGILSGIRSKVIKEIVSSRTYCFLKRLFILVVICSVLSMRKMKRCR